MTTSVKIFNAGPDSVHVTFEALSTGDNGGLEWRENTDTILVVPPQAESSTIYVHQTQRLVVAEAPHG